MNRRSFLSLSATTTLLAGCDPFLPRYDVRYRLKIAIKIGDRLYEGASVNRTMYTLNGWGAGFDGVGAYYGRPWAEAAIVDLGPHGLLFGLVSPPQAMAGFYAKNVADVLLPHLPKSDLGWNNIKSGHALEQALKLKGEYTVPDALSPVLVRFRDVKNKRSAELVTTENVAQIYGIGAAIAGMSIVLAKQPLTERIETVLPWLESASGTLSGETGPVEDRSLSGRLTQLSFKLRGNDP